MCVPPPTVQPPKVSRRRVGGAPRESFDGRRIVGQLRIPVGPLAGKFGPQFQQLGVTRLLRQSIVDCPPQGIQYIAGRRIIEESLPRQFDQFRLLAPDMPHREPHLRACFPGQQCAELAQGVSSQLGVIDF